MKKTFYAGLFVLAMTVTLLSCSEDIYKNESSKGLIDFSMTVEDNLKSLSLLDSNKIPHAIYISIRDSAGNYIYNFHRLPLIKLGDQYITEKIELNTGYYTVEDFVVVDNYDSVLYLTPKVASEYAELVENPLPLYFPVSENSVTSLVLEVIPADKGEPASYGYATFSFTIVNTMETDIAAYYPFNGNAKDFSENINDGIVYGAVSISDRFNNDSSAFYFDGEDDYIELPTDFDFTERTICFWFKALDIPEWNYEADPNNSLRIIYTSDHPNIENGLTKIWVTKVNGTDKLCFHNGGFDVVLDNSYSIIESEWYFASVSVTASTIKYYLNGVLLKTREFPGNIHSISDTGFYNSAIGVGRLLNHRFFKGAIDDFRIYSRELTLQEVNDLYKMK